MAATWDVEKMEAQIQMNITQTSEDGDDTKASLNSEENALSAFLDELYYVYYNDQIMGPYKPEHIVTLFVANKIQTKCWVRCIKETKDDEWWCKLNLSSTANNAVLKGTYPVLYDYIAPKLACKISQQFDPPTKPPKDAHTEFTMMRKLLQLIGRIMAALALLLVALHVLPTMCVACLCMLPFVLCNVCDEDNEYRISLFLAISFLGIPIIPFLVVFVVLMGIVDDPYWKGEIQSWMIAYIAWGLTSFFNLLPVGILVGMQVRDNTETILRNLLTATFWIIGIDFGDIDIKTLAWGASDAAAIFTLFVFPVLASMLPASVVGFIANFVLEEKFQLQCRDDVDDHTLCYQDYGCCEVISSHDVGSSYEFLGGLASNILATWAVLRIVGYLMVNAFPEITVFAQRRG